MRDPDTLDYLFVAAITVLAYLQLPWRPEIRAWLRRLALEASAFVSGGVDGGVLLAALVVSVTLFIVIVSKFLPRTGLVE